MYFTIFLSKNQDLLKRKLIQDTPPKQPNGHSKLSQRKEKRTESRNSGQKSVRTYTEINAFKNISLTSSKESKKGSFINATAFDLNKNNEEEEQKGYSAIMKLKKALCPPGDTGRNRKNVISSASTYSENRRTSNKSSSFIS